MSPHSLHARGDRQFCQGAFLPLAHQQQQTPAILGAACFGHWNCFGELALQAFLLRGWLTARAPADKTHYLAAHFYARMCFDVLCMRPLAINTHLLAGYEFTRRALNWFMACCMSSECALQRAPRWYLQERHQIKSRGDRERCVCETHRPICPVERTLSLGARYDGNSVARESDFRSFAPLWATARWIRVAVKPNLSCDLRCHWRRVQCLSDDISHP